MKMLGRDARLKFRATMPDENVGPRCTMLDVEPRCSMKMSGHDARCRATMLDENAWPQCSMSSHDAR